MKPTPSPTSASRKSDYIDARENSWRQQSLKSYKRILPLNAGPGNCQGTSIRPHGRIVACWTGAWHRRRLPANRTGQARSTRRKHHRAHLLLRFDSDHLLHLRIQILECLTDCRLPKFDLAGRRLPYSTTALSAGPGGLPRKWWPARLLKAAAVPIRAVSARSSGRSAVRHKFDYKRKSVKRS
jgi:hypothetical protein